MFFQLAEILPNQPTATWDLAKQLGVNYAVANVPLDPLGQPTPDFQTLLWQKERFLLMRLKRTIEGGVE